MEYWLNKQTLVTNAVVQHFSSFEQNYDIITYKYLGIIKRSSEFCDNSQVINDSSINISFNENSWFNTSWNNWSAQRILK